MDIHAQFTGDVAETIDEMIKRGRAASKTEAIRIALLDYKHHHLERDDEEFYRRLGAESLKKDWDNPKEREAAKWYEERFRKGAYNDKSKKE